jgi:hypothetical protein
VGQPRQAIFVGQWMPRRHLGARRGTVQVVAVCKADADGISDAAADGGLACLAVASLHRINSRSNRNKYDFNHQR